jgi:membrane-associated phospholipid phosphatase
MDGSGGSGGVSGVGACSWLLYLVFLKIRCVGANYESKWVVVVVVVFLFLFFGWQLLMNYVHY